MTPEEARQLFEVRFRGAVAVVRHAAPRIRPGGSIVLTSGATGVRPSPGAALAADSAAAIEGLTKGAGRRAGPGPGQRGPARGDPHATVGPGPAGAADTAVTVAAADSDTSASRTGRRRPAIMTM